MSEALKNFIVIDISYGFCMKFLTLEVFFIDYNLIVLKKKNCTGYDERALAELFAKLLHGNVHSAV